MGALEFREVVSCLFEKVAGLYGRAVGGLV